MKAMTVKEHFANHLQVVELVAEVLAERIENCSKIICAALRDGKKILVMGNGGSAADAQHFAAELVGRFLVERRALPAIALTTDSSILTAVGNDYGFDRIFQRQVEALAVPGDVVIGISTSGNSANVLSALDAAKAIGCTTIGLLGRDGGQIAPIVDVNMTVPAMHTPHIQEAHVIIVHILCQQVEQQLFHDAAN